MMIINHYSQKPRITNHSDNGWAGCSFFARKENSEIGNL